MAGDATPADKDGDGGSFLSPLSEVNVTEAPAWNQLAWTRAVAGLLPTDGVMCTALYLAMRADYHTGLVKPWVTRELIAEDTHTAERTVAKAIKWLAHFGLCDRRGPDGGPLQLRMTDAARAAMHAFKEWERGASTRDPGAPVHDDHPCTTITSTRDPGARGGVIDDHDKSQGISDLSERPAAPAPAQALTRETDPAAAGSDGPPSQPPAEQSHHDRVALALRSHYVARMELPAPQGRGFPMGEPPLREAEDLVQAVRAKLGDAATWAEVERVGRLAIEFFVAGWPKFPRLWQLAKPRTLSQQVDMAEDNARAAHRAPAPAAAPPARREWVECEAVLEGRRREAALAARTPEEVALDEAAKREAMATFKATMAEMARKNAEALGHAGRTKRPPPRDATQAELDEANERKEYMRKLVAERMAEEAAGRA